MSDTDAENKCSLADHFLAPSAGAIGDMAPLLTPIAQQVEAMELERRRLSEEVGQIRATLLVNYLRGTFGDNYPENFRELSTNKQLFLVLQNAFEINNSR